MKEAGNRSFKSVHLRTPEERKLRVMIAAMDSSPSDHEVDRSSLRFYLEELGFDLAFDARLQSGQCWVQGHCGERNKCSIPTSISRSSYVY